MLKWIVDVVNSLGYAGVVVLMFLENVFPPLPSEVIMPLAGFAASTGDLSLPGVIIAGTTGSVAGALFLYYLGRKVGDEQLKKWADKHGKWLGLCSHSIERAESWFDEHRGRAVFFCHLVPGVRSLISIPAGVAGMNVLAFILYTTLGAGLWAGVLAYAGHVLGNNFERVSEFLGPVTYVVFGILAAAAVWWVWSRRNKRGETKSE